MRNTYSINSHLVLGLMIGAAICSAQSLPVETAQAVRWTVKPNVPSAIVMNVQPKARCVLHAEGFNDAEHSLKLFADDEGTVRFYVRPSAESDQTAPFAGRYVFQCFYFVASRSVVGMGG